MKDKQAVVIFKDLTSHGRFVNSRPTTGKPRDPLEPGSHGRFGFPRALGNPREP